MNDRAIRNELGAFAALDARAAASVRLARPLVRKDRWQCVMPTSRGEALACWWLVLVIFIEIAVLAFGIWSRR